MSEPKEDIDLLSQKELEDGEIEEELDDEPEVVIDNEPVAVGTDHDDSDANLTDNKGFVKTKKHKHHKKSLHRKRHINSEERGDCNWKKSRNNEDNDNDDDQSCEYNNNNNNNTNSYNDINNTNTESDNYRQGNCDNNYDEPKTSVKWGDYESDNEGESSNFNRNDSKSFSFNESRVENRPREIESPVYEATCVGDDYPSNNKPQEVSKWNDYDSDNETSTSNNNNNRNSFEDNQNRKPVKRWESNYNNNNNYNNNRNNDKVWGDRGDNNNEDSNAANSPVRNNDVANINNSPAREKSGWGSFDSPSHEDKCSKSPEPSDSSKPVATGGLGKWSYDSDEEGASNNNNNAQNSPKRGEDTQKWGSSNSPNNNNYQPQKWGNDDDSQKWGSRDSPKRNDDDNNNGQRWGNRDSPKRNDEDNNGQRWGSRDGSRRNNFRRWGGRDGGRRNNFRRWGGRDGSQRSFDNTQRWNSSNNDNNNDNNNKRWGSYNNNDNDNDNNNKRWGSYNNNDNDNDNNNKRWGSYNNNNNDNDSNNKRWGSYNNDNDDSNKKWGSYNSNNDNDKKWGSNNASPQRNDGNQKWGSSNNSPQRGNDNKRWGSNNASPQRNDGNQKWGSPDASPQRNDNKWASNDSPKADNEKTDNDTYDLPQKSAWGAYDSDDESKGVTVEKTETKMDSSNKKWDSGEDFDQKKSEDNNWNSQDSPKRQNSGEKSTGFGKWGDFDSDEEGKPAPKENNSSEWSNKSNWKSYNSDDESKGTFNDNNENKNKGNYNNNNSGRNRNNDFRNDRGNDFNDRNKKWQNRNDNEKRNICKYYSMGNCRHGDRCTYLHESPNKPVSQESKKKELCKFYEHQQCYKRVNCVFMHEEFPCKLFHAGSKMCPSGDGCKYSHAPLNQETKALLEKYLDEKVDERTDKIGSEWSSIKKSNDDDIDDDNTHCGFDQSDSQFVDPMRHRYPGGQDLMRFPVRPWNPMMPMQVPHQMEFMHRQRFMYDRFPYGVPAGRMFPRGFRGMVPPNMHEGFSNGIPYSIPPLIPGNPKMHPGNPSEMKENFNMSDPYLDNLAQLVVSKDSSSSPKRLVDMLDPSMQCEDIDDFSLDIETNNPKKSLTSPVIIKSPEVPPGAYVPRSSMNVAQPNVRLGPGPSFGSEQAMLYGGYPAHPNDSTMLDYINISALHYYHNQPEPHGYDVQWKLILLEVPIKIPYPLMVIDTQDLGHKYTDPRLKGHPSVLNSSNTNEESIINQNSYEFNSISTFGSQLQSPNFVTTCSESSETLTPLNDFLPKSDDPESPMFGINEEIFSFKNKLETEDLSKKISDRSYLQDPRFKRKKVNVNIASESSEMD